MVEQVPNLVITRLERITAFDIATGAYKWALEDLEGASLTQEETIAEIKGRRGRTIQLLKQNKTVRLSATNSYVSMDLLASQSGDTAGSKVTQIAWADYPTVTDGKAFTNWRAYGTAGAEIRSLHIRHPNGALGQELFQAAEPSPGYFAYDPDTLELNFDSDVPDGTVVVARYRRRILASVVDSSMSRYAGKLSIYIDAFAKDVCDNVYHVQLYFPKADLSGQLTFDIGGDQTVHSFEATALPGGCGARGDLWTYTIFGAADREDGGVSLRLGIGKLDVNSMG